MCTVPTHIVTWIDADNNNTHYRLEEKLFQQPHQRAAFVCSCVCIHLHLLTSHFRPAPPWVMGCLVFGVLSVLVCLTDKMQTWQEPQIVKRVVSWYINRRDWSRWWLIKLGLFARTAFLDSSLNDRRRNVCVFVCVVTWAHVWQTIHTGKWHLKGMLLTLGVLTEQREATPCYWTHSLGEEKAENSSSSPMKDRRGGKTGLITTSLIGHCHPVKA